MIDTKRLVILLLRYSNKPEELMLVFLYISEKMIEAFYGNKMKS